MKKDPSGQRNVEYIVMDPAKQKRKYARMNVELDGKVRISGKSAFHECKIVDIGSGGMRLHGGSLLYEGDSIEVQFQLEENKDLAISGPVIRTQGKYAVIQFPEKGLENFIASIQEFINKNLFTSENAQKLL